MVFREQLTVESQDSIKFGKSSGCFVSRRCAGILAVLFVLALLATGLVVYRLSGGTDSTGDSSADRSSTGAGTGSGTASSTGSHGRARKVRDVRLPTHLLPRSYNIRLLPFIEEGNFTFDGSVKIHLHAVSDGNNVTVHVKDMIINNDSVKLTDTTTGSTLKIVSLRHDIDREFFIVETEEGSIKRGHDYEIEIEFVGNLNDKLAGFYRSSYTDTATDSTTGNVSTSGGGNTTKKWLAVTQFQPTDARRAFPCLDEPALKATFNVTLGHRKNMHAISNMPLDRTEPIEGKPDYVWDIFKQSVPMSTYLIAFLVSEFDMKKAEIGKSKTLFRVWSRPQALAQAEYARKIGPTILDHFEDFFKTKFPLPKQDMVALPDFSAGAMENWGLITYRETAMLYQPGVSSEVNKQRVAIVVSHELAHQWFGNLVTPSWWTDLWLNEGFASYVEYLGVDKVEPEWKMMEQFITEDLQSVMTTDALETSHPISIVVGHPDEISEIFDKISYQKGASIIRMMDHYLTSETLRSGLSNYLQKYEYRAAEQDDLWRVLTEQAHKDNSIPNKVTVKQIMDTWTLQMGYPVIKVERNYEQNSAKITQSRFLLNKSNATSSDSYLWWVPLTYTDQKTLDFKTTKTRQWLPKTREGKIDKLPDANQWVIFNIQQHGYYKVNYDIKNWKMLIAQLIQDHTKIHTANRAQLIDDSFDLARSGQLDYDTALSILKYLASEKEYIPWRAAFSNLHYLNTQLKRTSVYGQFKKYILSLVEDRYKTIKFQEANTDNHLDHFQRANIVSWACSMGHADCIQQSKQLFSEWMQQPANTTIIPANIRSTVYCTAIKHGDQLEWDFAWKQYLASNVASEKKRLLKALGCSQNVWLLSRYLEWIVKPTARIRVQDGTTVFAAVTRNVVGRYLSWNFMRNRWPELRDTYGGGVFQLANLVSVLKSGYNTRLELEELTQFAERYRSDMDEAHREMQQAIEHCKANLAWMDNNYNTIAKWMEQNSA